MEKFLVTLRVCAGLFGFALTTALLQASQGGDAGSTCGQEVISSTDGCMQGAVTGITEGTTEFQVIGLAMVRL